ncbi:MAG TPA: hypothetical protein PKW05_09600 [Anaerolineae bacterium]|nr:hypothetical protein [Anaerolineae bacterium]
MERVYPKNGIAAMINARAAAWIVPMHPSPYRFGSEELMKSPLFRGAMEAMVVEEGGGQAFVPGGSGMLVERYE